MKMAKRIYSNSKSVILEAALRVLSKGGLKAYTTDAVIRESGLSKAGFFYNFKSKDELTVALAKKLHDEWSEEVLRYEREDPNPVGRTLRAYVRACGDYLKDKEPGREVFNQALSELLVSDAEFAKNLGSYPRESPPINREQGLPVWQEMLIFMSTEGLWYQNLNQSTQTLTQRQKKELIETLLKMTEGPINFSKPKRKKK